MTTYAGKNALLKLEDSPGSGTFSTVAKLTSVEISISNDEPTASLQMHTSRQHSPDASGQRTVTVTASGFANNDSSATPATVYEVSTSGNSFSVNGDGSVIAAGDFSGEIVDIIQWNGSAYTLHHTVTNTEAVTEFGQAVTISNDGLLLLVGDGSANVIVYNRNTVGDLFAYFDARTFSSGMSPVNLTISGDTSIFALAQAGYDNSPTTTDEGRVITYTVEFDGVMTQTVREVLSNPGPASFDLYGSDVSLSNDGSVIAISEAEGRRRTHVYAWNGSAYALRQTINTSNGTSAIAGAEINGDGSVLWVGTDDDTRRIYKYEWDGSTYTKTENFDALAAYAISYPTQIAAARNADVICTRSSGPEFTGAVAIYRPAETGDSQIKIINDFSDSNTTRKARVYLASGDYYEGDARITSLSISGGHNDALQLSLSLAMSNTTYTVP